MDLFEKILDISEKGFKGPYDWISVTVLTIILTYGIFVRLHKIKSFSEFDRLFFPKNEKGIQEKLTIMFDYITFSLLYFFFGIFYSTFLPNLLNFIIHYRMHILINWIFHVILLFLIIKVVVKKLSTIKWLKWLNKLVNNNFENFSNKVFYINYYLSLVVYTFWTRSLLTNIKFNYSSIISVAILLFILPVFFLYIHRSYNNKINVEYLCTFITEKDFNDSKLVVQYSLDKDRMVFRKPDDIVKNTIYMYDRSSGKYYKFTHRQEVNDTWNKK